MANAGWNDLQRRKQALLTLSEQQRQQLRVEMLRLESSTAWIVGALRFARVFAPALAVGAPLAGWLFRSRKRVPPPPRRRGWLAKAIAGYQFARQFKPVLDTLRYARRPAWGQDPNRSSGLPRY